MTDYISRQAVIDNINDFIKKCYARGNDIRQYQEGLTHYVLNIPAADVVEGVNCKECNRLGKRKCPFSQTKDTMIADNFCSYWERRDK